MHDKLKLKCVSVLYFFNWHAIMTINNYKFILFRNHPCYRHYEQSDFRAPNYTTNAKWSPNCGTRTYLNSVPQLHRRFDCVCVCVCECVCVYISVLGMWMWGGNVCVHSQISKFTEISNHISRHSFDGVFVKVPKDNKHIWKRYIWTPSSIFINISEGILYKDMK